MKVLFTLFLTLFLITDTFSQDYNSVISQVNTKAEQLTSLYAEGEIDIRTRKDDQSASIEIKVKKPDDVYFKIEGPLGIDVASAHINRSSFTYLNSLKDLVITGPTKPKYISSLARVPGDFDDLMNVFSGTVKIAPDANEQVIMEEKGNYYILTLKKPKSTKVYFVEKSSYEVHKFSKYNSKNQVILEVNYSSFTGGAKSFARRIDIKKPQVYQFVTLKIENYNTSPSSLTFYVDIPSGVRRVKWK